MKGFELTELELQRLRVAHKAEKNKRYAYRLNALILLGSGWTLASVKEALLLDEETLSGFVKTYKENGLKGLLKLNYRGSEPYLSKEQTENLCQALENRIYLTTQAVIAFVKKEFKVLYSQSGMRDVLHRLGYEYKKPKLVPGHPDPQAQEIFAEQYEAFMLKKPDDVEVLFMDAVHPQHNTMAAYGWFKRGESREIATNSGRERLNLHGAMNAETYEVTVIESVTVDDESTLQLLQTVEQKYALAVCIYIILDNARYHYSRKVKAYLENSRIKLVFLPCYSPNLNLIERLWKFFKKKVLYNTYYQKLEDFRQACIKFFRNISRYQTELTSLMGNGFELA